MNIAWAEQFDINSFSELNPQGFCGFEKIASLGNACCPVPKEAGVYMVLIPDATWQPVFRASGAGDKINKVAPKSLHELEHRWVQGARIVYIGKAGGPQYKTTLKVRLQAYMRYGNGIKAAHRGGRSIWQMKGVEDCLVVWRVAPEDPRACERILLQKFNDIYRNLPFANRQR